MKMTVDAHPLDASPADDTAETRNRIALAAGVALLVAGLLLVAVVLPAEYAADPLGTGARLGLLDLGTIGKQVDALTAAAGTRGADQTTTVVAQEGQFTHETVEFKLAAQEGMEYKYRLDKGEALLYQWTSTGSVNYELHAEPDGAPRGYAESYEKVQGVDHASGTLTAPFAGIHGWFWQNATDQPVTVTLKSAGFYNIAHEFRDGTQPTTKTFQ
jgi:hypothetical protein